MSAHKSGDNADKRFNRRLYNYPTLESPVRYEFRQPQSADLLKMIDSVLLMEEQVTYHEDVTTFILEQEPSTSLT